MFAYCQTPNPVQKQDQEEEEEENPLPNLDLWKKIGGISRVNKEENCLLLLFFYFFGGGGADKIRIGHNIFFYSSHFKI